MRSINSDLLHAFRSYVSNDSPTPGRVDEREARDLVELAKDQYTSTCCGFRRQHTGQRDLKALLERHQSEFSEDARGVVAYYLTRNEVPPVVVSNPDPVLPNEGGGEVTGLDPIPGSPVVSPDVPAATNGAVSPSSSVDDVDIVDGLIGSDGSEDEAFVGGADSSGGTSPTSPVVPSSPVAPVSPILESGEVLLGKWQCKKPTWHCHWFPMKASSQPGGDAVNNFYAKGGILDSYDQAFGTKSKEYEQQNYAKPYDPTDDTYDWWGFCNRASSAAAVLREPTTGVTANGVYFSPHAIAGLLVKVVPSLVKTYTYSGERYNGPSDDLNEPSFYDFLTKTVQKKGYKASDPMPIVLDHDRTHKVWNYPKDGGAVYESKSPPEGFDASTVPQEGHVRYYRTELTGTGYEEQNVEYRGWIQYKDATKTEVLDTGWIFEDADMNPDFEWQPVPMGDLTKKEFWVTNPRLQDNPFVRAEDVYPIYMASIGMPVDDSGRVNASEAEEFEEVDLTSPTVAGALDAAA